MATKSINKALKDGDEQTIAEYVRNKLGPGFVKTDGSTLFHKSLGFADGRWNHRVAEWIAKDPSLVNMKDGSGETPMEYAIRNGNKDGIMLLAKAGARIVAVKKDAWSKEARHCTVKNLLTETFRKGDGETVRFILDNFPDAVNEPSFYGTVGGFAKMEIIPPLTTAIFLGKTDIVSELVGRGASIAKVPVPKSLEKEGIDLSPVTKIGGFHFSPLYHAICERKGNIVGILTNRLEEDGFVFGEGDADRLAEALSICDRPSSKWRDALIRMLPTDKNINFGEMVAMHSARLASAATAESLRKKGFRFRTEHMQAYIQPMETVFRGNAADAMEMARNIGTTDEGKMAKMLVADTGRLSPSDLDRAVSLGNIKRSLALVNAGFRIDDDVIGRFESRFGSGTRDAIIYASLASRNAHDRSKRNNAGI